MKKTKLLYSLIIITSLFTACKQKQASKANTTKVITPAAATPDTLKADLTCNQEQILIYEDKTFASYTEDKIRGDGVVSFNMNVNDRLTIYNEDDSVFGEIVMNEDMSYSTTNMPKKIIARNVITTNDFAAFEFDADKVTTDKDYLIIYVNQEKRRVKKTALTFTYSNWNDYIKDSIVSLKSCNLLKDASGKPVNAAENQVFKVTAVKGDSIRIKSSEDCAGDQELYKDMQGWVKWRSADALLINLSGCN